MRLERLDLWQDDPLCHCHVVRLDPYRNRRAQQPMLMLGEVVRIQSHLEPSQRPFKWV